MKKYILTAVFTLAIAGLFAQKAELRKDGKYYDNGKLYNGIYVENDAQGVKVAIHNLKDGLENGTKMIYFPNGKPKEHQEFKAGKKTGTWMSWNEKGVKLTEYHYFDNLENDSWITWDTAGVKRSESFYDKGKKKGTWKEYDETGKLKSEKKY